MRGFGSDNHSGVHPEIMKVLQEANLGHAPSYGTDSWSQRAEAEFSKIFNAEVQVYFVFNGTGANVLGLRTMSSSYGSVLCSVDSHLHNDECGAPEFMAQMKLQTRPSPGGKLDLEDLKKSLIRRGDQHYAQIRGLSLTQPTELGTVYSLEELRSLCSWAKAEGLWVHLDGARIANAVVGLNTDFKTMVTETGVDVVSFGGTKNGFMFGEALVFLNSKLAEEAKYFRKQMSQLPSKTRFVAAQFEHYLNSGLWRQLAQHSMLMAKKLKDKIIKIPRVEITQPVQSNVVFARIPKSWVKPLREKYFFYVWDELTFECRWMTSWDTTEEDIDAFVHELEKLSKQA